MCEGACVCESLSSSVAPERERERDVGGCDMNQLKPERILRSRERERKKNLTFYPNCVFSHLLRTITNRPEKGLGLKSREKNQPRSQRVSFRELKSIRNVN